METIQDEEQTLKKIIEHLRKLKKPVTRSYFQRHFKYTYAKADEICEQLRKHDNIRVENIGLSINQFSYSKTVIRKFYNISDQEVHEIAHIALGGGNGSYFNNPFIHRFSDDGIDIILIMDNQEEEPDSFHDVLNSSETWVEIDRGLDVRVVSNTKCNMIGLVKYFIEKGFVTDLLKKSDVVRTIQRIHPTIMNKRVQNPFIYDSVEKWHNELNPNKIKYVEINN